MVVQVCARAKALGEAKRHDRYVGWFAGMLAHLRDPPKVGEFVDPPAPDAPKPRQTAEEIMATMDQWRAAMDGVAARAAPTQPPTS